MNNQLLLNSLGTIPKQSRMTNDSLQIVPYSPKYTDIFEFIQNHFQITELGTQFMSFWSPLFHKQEVLITNEILNFIYNNNQESSSESLRQYKGSFIRSLKNYNISHHEIKYDHPKAQHYDYILDEIQNLSLNNLSKKTWILMSLKDFKKISLKLSDIVAEYYLFIEEVVIEYHKYQLEENIKKLEIEKENERLTYEFHNLSIKQENETLKKKAFNINRMFIKRGNITKDQILYRNFNFRC